MIRFRLEHARGGKKAGPSPFGFPAYWAIYRVTRGYPRKIINLCHLILLTLIIQNRSRAGWSMTYACARRAFPERAANWKGVRMGVLAASAAALVVLVGLSTGEFTSRRGKETAAPPKVSDRRERRSRPSQNPKPAIPMGASTAVAAKSPRGGSLKRDSVTPSPPVQAAAPAYKEEGQQKAPLFFGELRVGSRDTLGRMIQFVYGAFNPQYLRSVLKANPQIKTADIISVGDVIRFPVMPVQLEQKPSEAWWVQVVQEKRLQDAHQFLTLFSKVASPMRMIPCWDSRQGLRFLVLLGKGFPNKDAAMARLKGLPTLLASDAKVLNETDRIRSLFPNSAVKTAASHGGAKKRR
jgi:general secretion pathway protein A